MADQNHLSLGQRILCWLAANLAGRALGLMFKTCRFEILTPEPARHFLEEGHPCIGVAWHRSAIFFLYFFKRLKPAIMVSASRDGEYLARFISMLGGVPVRGSSHRRGSQALKAMADLLARGQCRYAATVADGPTGPRYRAKKGMILLAQRSGLPLLPIMWSCDRAWVLKKAWDRTMIPKPFARIRLMAGRELRYPRRMSPREMERARRELEDELNRITRELDAICGYQDPP